MILFKVYFRYKYKTDSTHIIAQDVKEAQKELEKLFPTAYFISATTVGKFIPNDKEEVV